MNINAITQIRAIRSDQARLKNVRKSEKINRDKKETAKTTHAPGRMLQPTETQEYNRVRTGRWRNDSRFITQYISQSNQKRERNFVGRDRPSVVNKRYKRADQLARPTSVSEFNKVI